MTRVEVRYIPFDFSNLSRQKFGEYRWKCIFRAWDNNGRNINLYQAEFIAMDSVSRGSGSNVAAQGV